jgi:hypothetical protein
MKEGQTGYLEVLDSQRNYFDRLMQFVSLLCIIICGFISLLGVPAILITQNFNLFYLLGALVLIAIPLFSKRAGIFLFTLLLPLFGNRPGSEQAFILFFVAICLNSGFIINLLVQRKAFIPAVNYKNPVIFLAILYVSVSAFSLISLPLVEIYHIFKSQVTSWNDFGALSYVFLNLITSTEDRLSYSVFSVVWTLLSFSFMFYVYFVCQKNRENIRLTFFAILSGLLITLTAGLMDYYSFISLSFLRTLDPVVNPGGTQFRLQSFFGHSGWFAEYVTLCIPFSLIVLSIPVRFSIRLVTIIFILLLGEFSLILSFQRGGWVSYPLTLLIVWASIYVYQKLQTSDLSFISALKGSFLKIAVSIPLTLAATILVFYSLSSAGLIKEDNGRIISRYADRFTEITRSSDRTDFMKAGFMLGSLYPIMGGGSESFAYRFNNEFNKPQGAFYQKLNLPLFGSSHNVYMQTFAGKGAAGLILLISLIGYTIISSFRLVLYGKNHTLNEKIYLLGVASFCFAFLIYGNVQELFYIQTLQFIFFIILGLVAALHSNLENLPYRKRALIACLVLAAAIAHAFWVYNVNASDKHLEYGCYGEESDQKGKIYRWCGPKAQIALKTSESSENYLVSMLIETGHFKRRGAENEIKIYLEDKLVFQQAVEALKKYKFEFSIPKSVAGNAYVRDNINVLNLTFVAGNYFIPARDLSNTADYRVLAFKIYTP